jgi:hypothetical protein
MNLRKLTTNLSHDDIAELEAARDHAKALGLDLNTHLIFVPFDDTDVPAPADVAEKFGRLLSRSLTAPRPQTRPYACAGIIL